MSDSGRPAVFDQDGKHSHSVRTYMPSIFLRCSCIMSDDYIKISCHKWLSAIGALAHFAVASIEWQLAPSKPQVPVEWKVSLLGIS